MKISVIIPMFNASSTIVRALDSIKNQTYKCNYQILVVNDGSKDNSKSIVEGYIANNPEMDITLINQENGGVSKARNTGLKNATGDYIALLDSDDYWLPTKIERQINAFEQNKNIDVLATNRNQEYFKRFLWKKFNSLTYLSSKLLLVKNFISPPTVLMKKEILENTGFFDEAQRFAEEGDYFMRVCNNNQCFLLQDSLVITGDGKPHFGFSGLSSNLWGMEKGELKNIQTAYKLHIINFVEYIFLNIYSILKYIRRVIIVKLRKR